MEQKKIRLAKFLSQAGVASRRKAENLIKQGKVKIGLHIVKDLATSVPENSQDIFVNNKAVILEKKVYYLLNKPTGYVCSVSDPHNKKTVMSLVPKEPKVFPVGRLDKDSQGLILLTNDGDLAHQLTHPKFEVKKTYLVTVDKILTRDIESKLKKGISLEEGLAKVDKLKILSSKKLEIVIHQGWNRQIRRMLAKLGYKVIELSRISEANLKLGNLPIGKYKVLNKNDIK
ncbi:rRNA pseudouridine synthase [Patescibacteria group bacterium]|nr:rRNA pseudouridine synthase [Patescibacteria group bacterium]